MASDKSVAQYYENSLVATKFLNIWNLLRLHLFFMSKDLLLIPKFPACIFLSKLMDLIVILTFTQNLIFAQA